MGLATQLGQEPGGGGHLTGPKRKVVASTKKKTDDSIIGEETGGLPKKNPCSWRRSPPQGEAQPSAAKKPFGRGVNQCPGPKEGEERRTPKGERIP